MTSLPVYNSSVIE